MKKLYDLIIRVPVFQTDDGRVVGNPMTVLPDPALGAPDAHTTLEQVSLVAAVATVTEFAATHNIVILGEREAG